MKPVLAMTAVALLVSAAIVFAEDTPSTTSPAPATQAAPSKSTTKTHHTTSTSTSSTKSTAPKLDLNTASAEELAKLPGLDAAKADKIVADRPYKSRSDLVNKKIITKSEYSKIENHIMVKSSSTKSSTPKSSTAK
jgi:DNA uptake protein ComE-like DNA-binding protein